MTTPTTTPAATGTVFMSTTLGDWLTTRTTPHTAARPIHYEDGRPSWQSAVHVRADVTDWAIQELDELDWALGSGSNLPDAVPTHGITREQVGSARMSLLAAWLRLTEGAVNA